jgi:hypothetical protein
MRGRCLAALILAGATACDRNVDAWIPHVVAPAATDGPPILQHSAAPPTGIVWHIGFNEEVSMLTLERWYAQMAVFNTNLWNVTEGQVHLGSVIISDRVAPGLRASTLIYGAPPSIVNSLDMVVFVGDTWDVQSGGFVMEGKAGREKRIIGVPADTNGFVILHEGSHMMFRLTWPGGPFLLDEYADGAQDGACIMEMTFPSLRWCGADNHVEQSSQPTSCWQQVLSDYPNFHFAGASQASTPPPPVGVEFNNAP